MDRSEPGKSERRIRGNVQYGITRINFSLYWITLDENDRKQLHLSYARRGETSRDLMCSLKACHANCMHRWKCVVFKCVVAWKTVPFHDRKLLKNTLQISRNYFIPHRNEEKMNYAIMIFLVSILKIGVITSSRTLWSSFTLLLFYSFTYTALMMWSPLQDRAMQNVQSPSLKTSNEEFLTKITYLRDHWMESACWEEQTQELMWGASTLRSYIESDDFIGQIIKFFITEVATAVTTHNKL